MGWIRAIYNSPVTVWNKICRRKNKNTKTTEMVEMSIPAEVSTIISTVENDKNEERRISINPLNKASSRNLPSNEKIVENPLLIISASSYNNIKKPPPTPPMKNKADTTKLKSTLPPVSNEDSLPLPPPKFVYGKSKTQV